MNKQINKKVGIKDIASRAGVSIGTVDRVLHNRGEVKAATHKKILAIVEELGYKPNILAKSLASKKPITIAIVIPDSSDNNPYWEKPVQGIKKAADELVSYNIQIIFEYFDASDEQSFINVLDTVCGVNPDGVVLNPVFKSSSLHFISIFNTRDIPYVFVDVDINGVDKLGFFGQDAEQSGVVAASLMNKSILDKSNILIVKLSNKKVFSQHIELRVQGFLNYFKQLENTSNKINDKVSITTIEIDLEDRVEPDKSLANLFGADNKIDGVFVPNSRVYKVSEFLRKNRLNNIVTVGYDLVDQNIYCLEQWYVTFLISQKPEEQAYNAITALFDYMVLNKSIKKTNNSPIGVIVKENLDYYKENR